METKADEREVAGDGSATTEAVRRLDADPTSARERVKALEGHLATADREWFGKLQAADADRDAAQAAGRKALKLAENANAELERQVWLNKELSRTDNELIKRTEAERVEALARVKALEADVQQFIKAHDEDLATLLQLRREVDHWRGEADAQKKHGDSRAERLGTERDRLRGFVAAVNTALSDEKERQARRPSSVYRDGAQGVLDAMTKAITAFHVAVPQVDHSEFGYPVDMTGPKPGPQVDGAKCGAIWDTRPGSSLGEPCELQQGHPGEHCVTFQDTSVLRWVTERTGQQPAEQPSGGEQGLTFSAFLKAHELTVEMNERDSPGRLKRYWCRPHPHTEIMTGGMLGALSGDGNTHDDAIADMARKAAGKRLAIKAYHDDRREIQCPAEWASEPAPPSADAREQKATPHHKYRHGSSLDGVPMVAIEDLQTLLRDIAEWERAQANKRVAEPPADAMAKVLSAWPRCEYGADGGDCSSRACTVNHYGLRCRLHAHSSDSLPWLAALEAAEAGGGGAK